MEERKISQSSSNSSVKSLLEGGFGTISQKNPPIVVPKPSTPLSQLRPSSKNSTQNKPNIISQNNTNHYSNQKQNSSSNQSSLQNQNQNLISTSNQNSLQNQNQKQNSSSNQSSLQNQNLISTSNQNSLQNQNQNSSSNQNSLQNQNQNFNSTPDQNQNLNSNQNQNPQTSNNNTEYEYDKYLSKGDKFFNGSPPDFYVNFREAAKFYRKAADFGSTKAMIKLGDIFRYGLGVEIDRKKAKEFYQNAYEKGDPEGKKLYDILIYREKNLPEIPLKKSNQNQSQTSSQPSQSKPEIQSPRTIKK